MAEGLSDEQVRAMRGGIVDEKFVGRTWPVIIKHCLTGAVLFRLEAGNLKLAVEAAVRFGANLRGADLRDADLRDANLGDANLRDADLRDARCAETMRLETGETLAEYRSVVVPALIAAGGHPVPAEAWTCHEWTNCPMAHAFGVRRVEDVPLLHRPRAEQFVRLFDAGLIQAPA